MNFLHIQVQLMTFLRVKFHLEWQSLSSEPKGTRTASGLSQYLGQKRKNSKQFQSKWLQLKRPVLVRASKTKTKMGLNIKMSLLADREKKAFPPSQHINTTDYCTVLCGEGAEASICILNLHSVIVMSQSVYRTTLVYRSSVANSLAPLSLHITPIISCRRKLPAEDTRAQGQGQGQITCHFMQPAVTVTIWWN